MLRSKLALLPLCLATTYCSSIPTPQTTAPDGSTVPIQRQLSVALDGDPNGLWWDAAGSTLYIADDNNNRLLKWTDATGLGLVATLPKAPADGPGLGQLIRMADGTIVVTRFGYGTAGDVVFVKPDGTTGTIPHLDPLKRRIGLTLASDGTLYDSYFVKTANGAVGAVARLTLEGEETQVVSALKKPVGVLAAGDTLFISDQTLGQILSGPLATPDKYTVLATLESPDLLAAGPDGSLFTAGPDGAVRQISATGDTSTLVSGLLQPRGTAFDAVNKRLFIANHDGDGSDGLHNTLEIVPVN